MWGEMFLPHGKLLMAMLSEPRAAMSVKRERQVTTVRTTGSTRRGKRDNERQESPTEESGVEGMGIGLSHGRVGRDWPLEAVY